MKYTRYDLERKKRTSNCFLLCLIGVLIGSVVIGTVTFKMFFQSINSSLKNTKSTYNENSIEKTNFTFIQCGVFSKKENAEELMIQLEKIGIPFEIDDNSKIRVFFGVYSSTQDINAAIKQLKDSKFDQNCIAICLNKENNCDAQIIDIVNADLEVFNKLADSKVKAIETNDFKKWVNKLIIPEQTFKNNTVLKEIKVYINKLPDKVTKDNIKDNKVFIYKKLKECEK